MLFSRSRPSPPAFAAASARTAGSKHAHFSVDRSPWAIASPRKRPSALRASSSARTAAGGAEPGSTAVNALAGRLRVGARSRSSASSTAAWPTEPSMCEMPSAVASPARMRPPPPPPRRGRRAMWRRRRWSARLIRVSLATCASVTPRRAAPPRRRAAPAGAPGGRGLAQRSQPSEPSCRHAGGGRPPPPSRTAAGEARGARHPPPARSTAAVTRAAAVVRRRAQRRRLAPEGDERLLTPADGRPPPRPRPRRRAPPPRPSPPRRAPPACRERRLARRPWRRQAARPGPLGAEARDVLGGSRSQRRRRRRAREREEAAERGPYSFAACAAG